MSRTINPVGTHPAPGPEYWNWCSRCGCSVDDDMRTGEFRDGSEGTCLGCGTVYVAEAMTDGLWIFREADLGEDEDEGDLADEPAPAPPAPQATYEGDLKVFKADTQAVIEWVIARSVEDAAAVWAENGMEPITIDDVPVPWTECAAAEVTQWSEDETLPANPTTYAELAKRGRGCLGSAHL